MVEYHFDREVISVRGSNLIKPIEQCPKFKETMIGSTACEMCRHHIESNEKYIICEVLSNQPK